MITQKEINDKWQSLHKTVKTFEMHEEADLAWDAYLKECGIVTIIHAQAHWGEGGVLDAVHQLIELLNSGQQVVVIEDPSADGSDYYSWLVFKK